MKLKRVRIFGFKTFADKTEFDLDGDLVAIVGPNGCGKSNIVDAILWGLGEPNARNLRATTSQDVIFNGSAKRKPLGFAEVTLIFDNEDGTLPIDAVEVSVSRRLTRAGDSHFSINKKTCRLKDIYDLLADSGLGRAGYAIVGQREIDQALSASAEERRAWIDEAAGVQRFRAKRTESVRRLDAAKDHLERIEQILADIEFQRGPLQEEAEIARRYQTLKASLVEIELGLLVREVSQASEAKNQLESEIAQIELSAQQGATQTLSLREQLAHLGEEIAELERQMDAHREVRQAQLSQAERESAQIQLGQQRLTGLDELEANLIQEQEREGEQASALVLDKESAIAEVARLVARREALSLQSGNELDAVRRLEAEMEALERELLQARAEEERAMRDQADRESARSRLATLQQELTGIERTRPEMITALEEASESVNQLVKSAEELRDQRSSKREQLHLFDQKKEALLQQHRQDGTQRAILEGKRRGLEATLETHEGLAQGSLAVLQLVKQGKLPDVYRPVNETIHVSKALALAIEIALGATGNDLIVPNETDAKRAIELLKANRLGRATFQPLTMVKQGYQSNDLRRLSQERGVIGIASELVEVDNDAEPVIQSLLGRIVIVETLDDALRLNKTQGWSRMVTIDGEVVHGSGAVTGGKSNRQSSGILQRRAELTEIESQIESLISREGAYKRSVEQLDLEHAEQNQEIAAVQVRLDALEREQQVAVRWFSNLEQELKSSEREADRLRRELEGLEAILHREALQRPNTMDLVKQRDLLSEKLAAAAAEAKANGQQELEISQQLREAQSRLQQAEQRLTQSAKASETRSDRLSRFHEEREALRLLIERHESALLQAQERSETAQTAFTAVQTHRSESLEASYRLSEELKALEELGRSITEKLHRLEIDRARAETRRVNALQRLMEEYGMAEEDALVRDGTFDIPEDATTVVGRLRRDVRALGDVNIGAIEAYDRLTARYNELEVQRADVQAGLDEIQHAVRELDRLTRDRFLSTFERVNEEFGRAFQELFGGGEASLSLTETDSVLSAGVDVSVVIPGKKRQKLELLSGGERSMSAVAFLFALLRVNPSPLVVLDEVDAPLDGRNVERYVNVLQSFKGQTQFLVITHNPVTIEAAPTWFGVTMQEPGCTSLLPCRVDGSSLIDDVVAPAFLH